MKNPDCADGGVLVGGPIARSTLADSRSRFPTILTCPRGVGGDKELRNRLAAGLSEREASASVTIQGLPRSSEAMKFLVSIHRPNGYDHSAALGPEVVQAIDDVNDEMVAAGVRLFVGGLKSPTSAKSICLQPDGALVLAEGAYLDGENYVDGIWVLECESMEEAIEWGKKAALACRGSVEVRPFAGALVG